MSTAYFIDEKMVFADVINIYIALRARVFLTLIIIN